MTRHLNSWPLFWVLALAVSVANLLGLSGADFHTARGMSPVILLSVRCALPLFLVAFTASSLATLWRSACTRWLLANRRYIGLAFAFAMIWHFTFVAYTIRSFGNPLNAKATALDLIGLVFLLLLTLTSFRPFARHLSRPNWRRLHKTGVYAIWLVATAIYFHAVREGWGLFHRVVFALLLAAWGLRVAAWTKKTRPRHSAAEGSSAA
jgi:methionine sulfoxide reductase heme-binding subunit